MPLGSSQPTPRKRVAGARRRPATAMPRRGPAVASSHHAVPAVAEPAVDTRADTTADAKVTSTEKPARRHTRGSLWASALAVGLAFALLAGTLVYSLRPALGEGERTAAVGSARTTLESLLSYTGASFDAHVSEVTPLLAAPFKDEFATVAARDIKPLAVKNGAVVQARVFEAGVMDTTGDGGPGSTVRVMAFLNQATTTTEKKVPTIDQNRVIATMTKVATASGDRWLVSGLEAY